MSSSAFISFSDAMLMFKHKKLGHKLPAIFVFDGVHIHNDLSVYGYDFGDHFSAWVGRVNNQSMLFNPHIDHTNDSSSINIQLWSGNFTISLAIDQSCFAGHDFHRADIRVRHNDTDITDLVFPNAGTVAGTKDNMITAMQRCNIMCLFA
jgi:hypothetical protein